MPFGASRVADPELRLPRRRMTYAHPAPHLLRAKDLVDARYAIGWTCRRLPARRGLARALQPGSSTRRFGGPPHKYLPDAPGLERAAEPLRNTDRSVADICLTVGLRSLGSFTTSFHRRFGMTPTAYWAAHQPALERARVPTCVSSPGPARHPARLEKTAARRPDNVACDSGDKGGTMLR